MNAGTRAEHSGHVFICYATDDNERVATLERIFTAHRILVWRSESSLKPGDDWRARIRHAIEDESLAFLACFSTRSVARESSYQRDELLTAIDDLRSRQAGSSWLIPVRFDDCQIAELPLGGGRTLASIQRADLFGPRREQNTTNLLNRIKDLSRLAETDDERPEEPPAKQSKPGWMTAMDVFDRTYQEWIGWTGTMISPVAMSAVLHLDTDAGVAAVYLSRVPVRKAARMLAASPAAKAGEVLKLMNENKATAILSHIPANIAQSIVETM